MPVRSPLRNRKVTGGFRTKLRPTHNGTDYRAPTGTPLYAAIDGVVTTGSGHKNAGTWVEIRGAKGVMVGYSHMSARNVKSGSRVRAGDIIGASGATGRAFGAHLHFYVKLDGNFTNPEAWLKRELTRQATPAKATKSSTADWLTRAEIRKLQAGLRKRFPAYRWSVNVKRGQLITIDGFDGPQTEAWVREFQRRTGLTQDGIAGPDTKAMLARHGIRL